MSALPALMAHDLRLQWRYGIHLVYGAVIALYAAFFLAAGPYLPNWLVAVLIYSDPSVLGFFFLGGLMLLEKGEGVRSALAVSPVSATGYLAAKTVTLTALALVAVAVLTLAKPGPANWPLLLAAVTLTSVFFIAIGAAIALRFRTLNGYLIGSAVPLLPLVLPAALAFLDPWPIWLGLIPTAAQLKLILIALGFGSASPLAIAIMIGAQLAATAAALFWARARLQTELGPK